LKIDSRSVSSAALDGELMMLMLGAIAVEDLDLAVVTTNGDTEPDNIVTSANHLEVVFRDSCLRSGAVEEQLNLLEETGFLGIVGNLTELFGNGRVCSYGYR
jgi:hypothetical protein